MYIRHPAVFEEAHMGLASTDTEPAFDWSPLPVMLNYLSVESASFLVVISCFSLPWLSPSLIICLIDYKFLPLPNCECPNNVTPNLLSKP